MWLITSWWAALVATAFYIGARNPKAYHLDWLCLMLWGLAVMALADRLIGYALEGGAFLEVSVDALLVGAVMLIPVLLLWEVAVLISRAKRR
jgi:hypothetical protein